MTTPARRVPPRPPAPPPRDASWRWVALGLVLSLAVGGVALGGWIWLQRGPDASVSLVADSTAGASRARRLDTLEHGGPRQILTPADTVWQRPLLLALADQPLSGADRATLEQRLPSALRPWWALEPVRRAAVEDRVTWLARRRPEPLLGELAARTCDAATARDASGTMMNPRDVAHVCALGVRRGTWARWRVRHGDVGRAEVAAAAAQLLRVSRRGVGWGESDRQLLVAAAPLLDPDSFARLVEEAFLVGDTVLATTRVDLTAVRSARTPEALRLGLAALDSRNAVGSAASPGAVAAVRRLTAAVRARGRRAEATRTTLATDLVHRVSDPRIHPIDQALFLSVLLDTPAWQTLLMDRARFWTEAQVASWAYSRVGRRALFELGARAWEAGQWQAAAQHWERLSRLSGEDRAAWWGSVAAARAGDLPRSQTLRQRVGSTGYYALLAGALPPPTRRPLLSDRGLDTALAGTAARAAWWRALGADAPLEAEWGWWRRQSSRSADSLAHIASAMIADGHWWTGGAVAWRAWDAEWAQGGGSVRDTIARLVYPLPRPDLLALGLHQVRQRAPTATPDLLAALIQQESRWSATIRSPVGALGWTQVMPQTAAQLAPRLERSADSVLQDLRTPAWNIQYGGRYLGDQLASRQMTAAALAAYNAGPSRAIRWRTLQRTTAVPEDSLWFVERIPFAETRGYVRRITAGRHWYQVLWFARPMGGPASAP